ncbi:hypothetical protein ES708_10056 [subsurface metagenome]
MKNINLFLILPALFVISCDKEEFSTGQSESFIKYYGSNKPYTGVSVLTTDDGGCIILGNFENPGRSQDICLIRTDQYGNTIAPVLTYGGLFDDFAYAIKKNDNGYVIAGSTKESSQGDKDIYLIQIDEAGDTLWTSSFGSNFNLDDEAFDVLVLDNGDLVLTGYSEILDDNNIHSDLLIAKINAADSLLWYEVHGQAKNEFGNAIIEAGDYFIIGGSTNSRPEYNTYNGYMVQVTKEGTNPSPLFFGTEGDSEVTSIVDAGNNTYFAACNVQSPQKDESKVSIVKFNHDERDRITTLWTKDYGEQIFSKISFGRANNNAVYFIGTSGENIETGDILLLRLDPDGNFPEYFYAGDGISFTGSTFDFAANGGYILAGTNYSTENSVIALIRLNSEGTL